MVDTANEARSVAAKAATALRLVNEIAAESLIEAVGRGETRARMAIERVQIPVDLGRVGRLYDDGLVEAFERAGEHSLARACRILYTLGFAVAAVPEVEREVDVDRVTDVIRSIAIDFLELDFTMAPEVAPSTTTQLMKSVVLPAAYLWRNRAQTGMLAERFERKALALIAERADRGTNSCRLPWSKMGGGTPDLKLLQQVVERLRGRGFRVEATEKDGTLHVAW